MIVEALVRYTGDITDSPHLSLDATGDDTVGSSKC